MLNICSVFEGKGQKIRECVPDFLTILCQWRGGEHDLEGQ
jgi:hypothetical protein